MKSASKNSTNSVASIIISTFAVVAGISTVTTARAGDDEPRKTLIVSYADLNVDTEHGAKVLYARLRQAAQDVCSTFESRELMVRAKWLRCYDSAMSAAVGQVNKIAVTKLYQASVAPKTKS